MKSRKSKVKQATLTEYIATARRMFRPHWDGAYMIAKHDDLLFIVAMIEKLMNDKVAK